MTCSFRKISDIDQLIAKEMEKSEINSEEILHLVDTREQLLSTLLSMVDKNPSLKHQPEWQELLTRTKSIVDMMQIETDHVGKELNKFRYGQRSLQQYKKFT